MLIIISLFEHCTRIDAGCFPPGAPGGLDRLRVIGLSETNIGSIINANETPSCNKINNEYKCKDKAQRDRIKRRKGPGHAAEKSCLPSHTNTCTHSDNNQQTRIDNNQTETPNTHLIHRARHVLLFALRCRVDVDLLLRVVAAVRRASLLFLLRIAIGRSSG
jgi:hypothetical protein